MKTCLFCKKKYEDYWTNWYNKYCCSECFRNKETKYKEGNKIYTNKDIKKNGYLTAYTEIGEIIKIYIMNSPTTNGLYQYVIKFKDNKIVYRFLHQLFETEKECDKYVEVVNKRRELTRAMKEELKKL